MDYLKSIASPGNAWANCFAEIEKPSVLGIPSNYITAVIGGIVILLVIIVILNAMRRK